MLVVLAAAIGGGFFFLSGSPPVDEAARAAVESFTRAVLSVESGREVVSDEFQNVGTKINTTDFDEVFQTLESVIRQQEELTQKVEAVDSPTNTTALAHTLLVDAYTSELEGYRMLAAAAGQAQTAFPRGTARRIRRTDGYTAAVSRLSQADHSRTRAYEELQELLDRVGLTFEEVRLAN